MSEPVLRTTRAEDLPALVEIQCDAEAPVMAAFTSTAAKRSTKCCSGWTEQRI